MGKLTRMNKCECFEFLNICVCYTEIQKEKVDEEDFSLTCKEPFLNIFKKIQKQHEDIVTFDFSLTRDEPFLNKVDEDVFTFLDSLKCEEPRKCHYCAVTSTPMWRHGPGYYTNLCNRCGLKWKRGKILANGDNCYHLYKGKFNKNSIKKSKNVRKDVVDQEIVIDYKKGMELFDEMFKEYFDKKE